MTSLKSKALNEFAAIKPHVLPESLSLSPLQRAYFIGKRSDFDLHVHPHLYLEFDLPQCDIGQLEEAVNQLIERHDMLRAVIHPEARITLSESIGRYRIVRHVWTSLSTDQGAAKLEQLRRALSRLDMDHSRPPSIDVQVSLLRNFHRVHISLDLLLFDGNSVRMLLSELSDLYLNRAEFPAKHAFDIAFYEDRRDKLLHSERYRRNRQYWFDRLADLPSEPVLPLKHSVNLPRRSALVRRKYVVEAHRWRRLAERCTKVGINPSIALLTAYCLVVSSRAKYQQFYVTMMLPGNDRDSAEMAGVAANFASVLLVEVDFRQRRTLLEHMRGVHLRVFRDMARSMVCGLEVLEERNRAERSTARAASPVAFVSMLNSADQPIPDDLFQLEGKQNVYNSLETPQVLLDHQAISRPDNGVSLILDAMDSAFEGEVVEDLFAAYVELVGRMADDAAVWEQSNFDFRRAREIRKHRAYNAIKSIPSVRCLHHYLYEKAARFPEKPLVIDASRSLTYDEVRRLVNRIAWTLRERHRVEPNELVAVSLPKGWQQIVAVHAILAAGAAYVPVMPNLPLQRKETILEQCGCRLMFCAADNPQHRDREKLTVLCVDHESDFLDRCDDLSAVQTQRDIAYVIFTSGSTGVPKGVVLDHLGPVNTIEEINRRFAVHDRDIIFGLSDLSFDLSVYDIFGSVAAGATLVLPDEGAQRDPARCEALVRKYAITVWNSVPALAQLLVEYLEAHQVTEILPLRLVLLSGDWIPVLLPERLRKRCEARIVSLGGATEASIWSIFYEIERTDPSWHSIPYGYPLTNQSIHILDRRLQARADHVPGEIYIGGIGVAKGYWEDPVKTDAAFIIHPDSGQRLYRTGDWGVRRPSGYVEFLGREDSQVKVRGFRIELGEIEMILQQHPAIHNAVVKVIGEKPEDAYIAAYVVCSPEDFDRDALHAHCARFLPDYMVPARFLRLDELPLNGTGKIDRNALPKPDGGSLSSAGTPARTVTELKLVELWRELLKLEQIGRGDNFFLLGGTSFTAVRLIALVKDTLGVSLPLATLMHYPQLAQLASRVDRLIQGDKVESDTHIVPLNRSKAATKQFWFHPSGGNVFCYREIAAMLAADVECYGIQASPVDNASPGTETIEQMVERYLVDLRRMQPSGPYYLAGWSLGGILAYAAAQSLINAGEEVASLILVDSPFPTPKTLEPRSTLLKWFISDLAESDSPLSFEIRPDGNLDEQLATSVQQARDAGLISLTDSGPLHELFTVFNRNIDALSRYRATTLTKPVRSLVIMANRHREERLPANSISCWKSMFCGTVVIAGMDGDHYSLLKQPAINNLFGLIRNHLTLILSPPILTKTADSL